MSDPFPRMTITLSYTHYTPTQNRQSQNPGIIISPQGTQCAHRYQV